MPYVSHLRVASPEVHIKYEIFPNSSTFPRAILKISTTLEFYTRPGKASELRNTSQNSSDIGINNFVRNRNEKWHVLRKKKGGIALRLVVCPSMVIGTEL